MPVRDDIIEMARQAGIDIDEWEDVNDYKVHCMRKELEAFAKLVMKNDLLRLTTLAEMLSNAQAVEREECAKICEDFADVDTYSDGIILDYHAHLIRLRGKA